MAAGGRVRTAEIAAALSLAIDLGTNSPFEHGLRSTCYAMKLAAELGVDGDDARQAFYLTALAGAGEASAELASLIKVLGPLPRTSIAARIAAVARELDIERTGQGLATANAMVRGRSRLASDRRIVEAAVALEAPGEESAWEAMLAAEPAPHRLLEAVDIDTALSALGVFGEMASPYFRGHSAAVSALAALVAQERGLTGDQVLQVRRAGLLHDLHRAGVPREVWEHPGPLPPDDQAKVRESFRTAGRVLARAPWLAEIGTLAVPTSGNEPALILAAADAYCAMLEDRPHRSAMEPPAAARALRADAVAGRFDPDVVESLLSAVGRVQRQDS